MAKGPTEPQGYGLPSYQSPEDLTAEGAKRDEILKYPYIKVRFIRVFTVFILFKFSLILRLVLHFPT